MLLKQSTARNSMIFMTDSSDHVTGKTGLTLSITASKDGGTFSAISPTITDRGDGWYNIALTTGHTDTLGDLVIHATGAGADPTDRIYQVVLDLPGSSVVVASGGISSSSFVVGAIDSGSLATSAVNEIRDSILSDGVRFSGANIDAPISSRMATFSYTAPDNATIAAINAKTTTLPANPASESTVVSVGNAVVTVGNNVIDIKGVTTKLDTTLILDGSVYQFTANALELAPVTTQITAADIRSAIGMASANLDTQLSGISASLSTTDGKINSIGILINNIDGKVDVAVSTRLSSAAYVSPDNTGIESIKLQTDKLVFGVAGTVNANIKYVNNIEVKGTGSPGNEWGP